MDDPASNGLLLERTLSQLELVNLLLSRVRYLLRRWVISDMLRDPDRHYSVLDIGAGGCDIALWIVRITRKKGVVVTVTCVDHDQRVVEYARRRCRGEPSVNVVHGDAFMLTGRFDYVISNHFLHHLGDEQVQRFLDIAFGVCGRRMVCNDLLRSHASILGFWLFATLFLRGSFSREDGILSILKGFRPQELSRMLSNSKWNGQGRLFTMVPGRIGVIADKPDLFDR